LFRGFLRWWRLWLGLGQKILHYCDHKENKEEGQEQPLL